MQLSTHDSPPLRRCLSAVSKLTFSKSKGNLYHSRFIRGRIPFLSSPSFPLLFLLFNSSELVSICYRTSIALLSMHALKPLLIVWKQTSVCFSLTMPSESRFFSPSSAQAVYWRCSHKLHHRMWKWKEELLSTIRRVCRRTSTFRASKHCTLWSGKIALIHVWKVLSCYFKLDGIQYVFFPWGNEDK